MEAQRCIQRIDFTINEFDLLLSKMAALIDIVDGNAGGIFD